MDPLFSAVITIIALLSAIMLGVHVGAALGFLSMVGIWLISGSLEMSISLVSNTAYKGLMEYVFGVIPMFVMMGVFANLSEASDDLYNFANILLAKVRGGVGIATVLANSIFAAITGVSIASAAVFSKIAMPQMLRLGYNKKFSLGIITTSAGLGMLIPPSLLLIVYGILSQEAIGRLFIAGILPGILLTLLLSSAVYFTVRIRPSFGGERPLVQREVGKTGFLKILIKPWVFMVLIFVVLGGMYVGFFTPTEAGAIGAFGGFILCLYKRKINWRTLKEVAIETGYTTASVLFLIICAQMYSRMLTFSGVSEAFTNYFVSLNLSPALIVFVFIIVYILLGALLDSTSILLICIPLMLPVIRSFGMDPIWFGIVSIMALELGFITPPFGMIVFTVKAALGDEVTLEEVFMGSLPFTLVVALHLAIICLVPWLSTWLPSLM